jgi:hypothetical protein
MVVIKTKTKKIIAMEKKEQKKLWRNRESIRSINPTEKTD